MDETIIYAFTGPEKCPADVYEPLRRRLEKLRRPQKVITGAAAGLDTIACGLALIVWPKAEHEVIVPQGRYNHELIKELRVMPGVVKITYMPKGTTHLDRNIAMVDGCTKLIACPQSSSYYRSGTWHTIHRAQEAHKGVLMFPIPALLRAL